MCTVIASNTAMLIATMIRKNFPKGHRFLKAWLRSAHAGNGLDFSAYRCVDIAARDRQNGCVHRSPLWPVVTRRVRQSNAPWQIWFGVAGPKRVMSCTYSPLHVPHGRTNGRVGGVVVLVECLIFASMMFIFLLPINDRKTAWMKLTVGSSLFVLLAAVLGPHLMH
jgi:hypothetical protein